MLKAADHGAGATDCTYCGNSGVVYAYPAVRETPLYTACSCGRPMSMNLVEQVMLHAAGLVALLALLFFLLP